MLIGEIVRQTGVSRDTIRHYEKLGLLQAEGRLSAFNNYKSYPATTVARLRLIQQGKNLGFTLAEIADGLDLWEKEGLSLDEIRARITAKLASIDAKIRQLEAMRGSLWRTLSEAAVRCGTPADITPHCTPTSTQSPHEPPHCN